MRAVHAGCMAGAAVVVAACTEETVAPDVGRLPPVMAVVPSNVARVARATTITELPPLPGETTSGPAAVNSSGLVVGGSGLRPVLWEDGEPMELPTLPGAFVSHANSINDAGQAASNVRVDGREHAVLWEDGTVTDIGTLPGHDQSRGTMNSAGHIIGTAFNSPSSASESRRGFVWREGEMSALPPVAGDENTSAVAGNGSGLVLGITSNIFEEPDDPRDEWRFVVWQDGEIIWVQEDSRPAPQGESGNEAWLGVTEAGDAYIVNTDVGALWRWRDGEVSPWPFESPWAAHATAVSPNGLVVGALMEDFRVSQYGVWKDEEFFPLDPDTFSHCFAISDAAHVLCEGPGHEHPFVTQLEFGEGDGGGGGDPAPTIDGVLAFFDGAVVDGSLEGSGPGESGERQRDALRNMLVEAQAMIEAGAELDDICGQLQQAHARADGATPPPDFVAGPAAATLAERVQALMDELGCA